jgi:quinol-cytochrome oxidoreductase complex cytochrome b subunit
MSDKPSGNYEPSEEKLIPFFPDYLLDEMIAWYIALAVLVVLASLFPAPLEEQANPLSTPLHAKPEWYFLFLYQFLKLVPRLVGVLAAPVGALILFLIPFLDRSRSRTPRARLVATAIGLVVAIAVVALGIWGWLS